MTLQEIQAAIEEHGDNFVQITFLNGTNIRCVLRDAYLAHPNDPRGYTEPYFYVTRIDVVQNPIEKFNCSEVQEIEAI